MKLRNVRGFDNIDDYVKYKLDVYSKKEKTFFTLFELMFDERDNVMVETTDGARKAKIKENAKKSIEESKKAHEELFKEGQA